MCIISKSLVNNSYDPFAHNLRLEHAKNAGFDSKNSFWRKVLELSLLVGPLEIGKVLSQSLSNFLMTVLEVEEVQDIFYFSGSVIYSQGPHSSLHALGDCGCQTPNCSIAQSTALDTLQKNCSILCCLHMTS